MSERTRTSRTGQIMLAVVLALMLPLAIAAHSGSFDWEDEHWTLFGDATASVDGGNAVITSTSGDADGAGLRIDASNLSGPDINDDGQPWVKFSYIDDGESQEGIDLFINPGSTDARISAGSMFTFAEGFGLERFGPGPDPEQNELFIKGFGDRAAGEHTVYIGQRPDGTIDANFDGVWFSSAFLKDHGQAPFDFEEILLRWRGGDEDDTITFTGLDYGDDHLAQRGNVTYVVDNDFDADSSEFPTGCQGLDPTHVTIQSAVDVALGGDEIVVCGGGPDYDEHVRVTGPAKAGLTLTGDPDEPATIAAPGGPSPDTAVFVTSPGATVTYLVMRGGVHDGIHVGGSGVTVEHNQIIDADRWGIRVGGSGATVNHNEVISARDGIYITGTNATINHNEVGTGDLERWGIAVVGGDENTVHRNEVHGHVRTHFNSSNNGVRHNTFETCTNDGDDNDWHRNTPDDCDVQRGRGGGGGGGPAGAGGR